MKSQGPVLDPNRIIATIELLEKRIADRFDDASLREVIGEFLKIARMSSENIRSISKPLIGLRITAYTIIALGFSGLIYSITFIDWKIKNTALSNIATLSEALFNDLVLIGAAIFFLVNMEARFKRRKALKALNQLRNIAHVIDMHQLTKDPVVVTNKLSTKHSPKRILTPFELQRYLDYCSEATALVAKVAAVYSQNLPDIVVVRTVNDIENLCTGLSRKIWQKLMILNELKETKIDNE